MERLALSDALNYDINVIDKGFDDVLFTKAREIRKKTALQLIANDSNKNWLSIDIATSMFISILERNPFENTEEVIKFNIMVTQLALFANFMRWYLSASFYPISN